MIVIIIIIIFIIILVLVVIILLLIIIIISNSRMWIYGIPNSLIVLFLSPNSTLFASSFLVNLQSLLALWGHKLSSAMNGWIPVSADCLSFVLFLILKQEIRKKPATPVPYNRYDQERFRGKEGEVLLWAKQYSWHKSVWVFSFY